MAQPTWNSTEVLAWTQHDGPGRAPSAPNRAIWFVLGGLMGVVFTAMVFTDTLCPEHRALVKALGAVALLGTATAAVGLIRGWASAPLITFISASIGVVIGLVDATHDPGRGRLLAAAFLFAAATSLFLLVRQVSLRWWEQDELASAASVDEMELVAVDALAEQPDIADAVMVAAPAEPVRR